MYSYEDRIRAVTLYIKLDKRTGATIRQLGYPTNNSSYRYISHCAQLLDFLTPLLLPLENTLAQAMKLLDLLIETRRDLLTLLCDLEGAHEVSPRRGTATANSRTRFQLQALLKRHLLRAEEFDIFLVTRHGACGRPDHTDNLIQDPRNKVARYGDEAFQWTHALYQGERNSVCPCAPNVAASKHQVVEVLVVRKNGASKRHARMVDTLSEVSQAIDHAGEGQSPSSIREHLLRAVLHVNEGILPQGVDDYIAARNALDRAAAAGTSNSKESRLGHRGRFCITLN